jgi:hypothetical protein
MYGDQEDSGTSAAGGLHPQEHLDQAGHDHQGGADQVADENRAGGAGLDQPAEQQRTDGAAHHRAEGVEDRDRHGAGLYGEVLADRQVGSAGAGRGEEEDDVPGDRLRRGGEDVLGEQRAEQQRAEEVADRNGSRYSGTVLSLMP